MLMSRPAQHCLFFAFMQEDTEFLVVMEPGKLMQLRASSSASIFPSGHLPSIHC